MDRNRARDVLGVAPGASVVDIERAFRQRARSAHPDGGGSAEVFRQLQEARETLLRGPSDVPRPVRVRRSLWQRVRRRLLRMVPVFLLPRHLRRRGRRLG